MTEDPFSDASPWGRCRPSGWGGFWLRASRAFPAGWPWSRFALLARRLARRSLRGPVVRWIEEASNALKKIKRGKSLRVVFFADPDQLWNFVSYLPDEYLCEPNGLFDWVAVQPWTAAFLRRWCSDQNLHEATGKIDELLNATGGWPLLLERYAESDRKNWNAKTSELQDYVAETRDDLLDALGLGSTMVRSQLAPLGDHPRLTLDDYEAYVDLTSVSYQKFLRSR